MKRRKTSTVKRQLLSDLSIKCVYVGPVNVSNTPSGKIYKFQPGETKTISDKQDYDYLLSLNKKAGCCGGAGQQERKYFEIGG